MKKKYLLPFLLLPFFHRDSEAQFKAEGNLKSLDVKSPYVDISARDTFGLQNIVNIRGYAQLKYGNNIVYFIRNGALNHLYGGNLGVGFFGGYYNRSRQSKREELETKTETPIGQVFTVTEISTENTSSDFGANLSYRNFSVSYEESKKDINIDGNTIIKIANEEDRIPFSSKTWSESKLYGFYFENGFFKLIKNKNQSITEDGKQNEEDNTEYLAKTSYLFNFRGMEIANLNIYYSEDFATFLNIGLLRNSSIKFIRDLDFNFSYNRPIRRLKATLSTRRFSELNQRDFELNLENELRSAPRTYDVVQETRRRYFTDMFFTDFFSGEIGIEKDSTDFEIDKDNLLVTLNLKYVLLHYSKEKKEVGARLGPAIAMWDFDRKEGRVGVFLDGKRKRFKKEVIR